MLRSPPLPPPITTGTADYHWILSTSPITTANHPHQCHYSWTPSLPMPITTTNTNHRHYLLSLLPLTTADHCHYLPHHLRYRWLSPLPPITANTADYRPSPLQHSPHHCYQGSLPLTLPSPPLPLTTTYHHYYLLLQHCNSWSPQLHPPSMPLHSDHCHYRLNDIKNCLKGRKGLVPYQSLFRPSPQSNCRISTFKFV